ncbi:MAG: hypothetical protein O7G84_17000, partial [Gammaproteobacteria bacterium]|nr:hypothetical protein [Gammaproteobacteria bacterium]
MSMRTAFGSGLAVASTAGTAESTIELQKKTVAKRPTRARRRIVDSPHIASQVPMKSSWS